MIPANTSTVPVIHSMIDPNFLLTFVNRKFGHLVFHTCRLLQANANDTYLLEAQSGEKYVYRVYRANWRTHSDILYEFDVLHHLKDKGVAVSYPIADAEGEAFHELEVAEGTRHGTLFTYAKGSMTPLNGENAPVFGRIAGEIHGATDDFSSTHQRKGLGFAELYDAPLRVVREWMAHRPDELAWAESVLSAFKTSLDGHPEGVLDRGFCHGDLHGGNIHSQDGTYTVFDFDCGGPGWRMYDLACVWWVARMVKNERPILGPFLESYVKHRSVDQKNLDAIPAFLALRHLWLFGFHATHKQHLGSGWVNDGYMTDWLRYLRRLEESAGRADAFMIGALDPWYLPQQSNGLFGRAARKVARGFKKALS